MKRNLIIVFLLAFIMSCQQNNKAGLTDSGLNPADFKDEVKGKTTGLYVLKNSKGMEVCVTNYGGRLVSIMVPDKDNKMRDVLLGFDNVQDYVKYPNNFGATIGRYGNRIANGKFVLDGKEDTLPQNNNGNCLHGGPNGFDTQVFDAKQINDHTLVLNYTSKDGEEGFPGTLKVTVKMTVTEDNAVDLQYEATTDKPTIVNLTNHSYFNLDGNPARNNYGYTLKVMADNYTPVNPVMITTGKIEPVDNTPMDFRTPRLLGDVFKEDFEQLVIGKGVDHNWVLNAKGDISIPGAELYSAESGIKLQVFTTEPGLQIYSGNFLNGSVTGKKGITYNRRASVCLESQKYPDTPNKADWPSCVLRPGETYHSRCIYKFLAD